MTTLPYPYGSGTGQLLENVSVGYRTDGPLLHDGEPRTAANINRAIDAVAQNVDTIWQRMTSDYHPLAVTRMYSYTVPAGSGVTGFTIPYKVFVGRTSDSGSLSISDILVLTNADGQPLMVIGQRVTIQDVLESPGGPSVFCGTATGFYEAPYISLSTTVPAGTEIHVYYGVMADVDSLGPKDLLVLPSDVTPKYTSVAEAVDSVPEGSPFHLVRTTAYTTYGSDNEVWSLTVPSSGVANYVLLDTDGSVVVYSLVGSTTIVAVKASTGATLWSVDLGAEILGLDVAYGLVHVAAALSSGGVCTYSASNGALLTTYTSPDLSSYNRDVVGVAANSKYLGLQEDDGAAVTLHVWEVGSAAEIASVAVGVTHADLAVDHNYFYSATATPKMVTCGSWTTTSISNMTGRLHVSDGLLAVTTLSGTSATTRVVRAGNFLRGAGDVTDSSVALWSYTATADYYGSPHVASGLVVMPSNGTKVFLSSGMDVGAGDVGLYAAAAVTDGWYVYAAESHGGSGYIKAYRLPFASRLFVRNNTSATGYGSAKDRGDLSIGKLAEVVR